MGILEKTIVEQMEIYKKETGSEVIEMFAFQEFIYLKSLTENNI